MMSVDYETARKRLEELKNQYDSHQEDLNEATTRMRFIDYLFFDCLGWSVQDCSSESSYGGEYADYTFLAPRPLMIVEAKREGNYFELPVGSKKLEYSIQSIMKDNSNLAKAIEQVAGYCQQRGVLNAVVCNGHQLVAFIAVRLDTPPLSGRALVFESLQSMLDNFLVLWNNLSKFAIQERKLENKLLDKVDKIPLIKLSDIIINYPGIKNRNPFQSDLKIVSELVMNDIIESEGLTRSFLEFCYCESGALSEYALLSKSILQARYSALFSNTEAPSMSPAVNKKGIDPNLMIKSINRRPILIMGDVGVGKTTFIHHLINIKAKEQFKDAIALHINLGHQASLALDIRSFILDEIEKQLLQRYEIDIFDDGMIRGAYHSDLSRFSRGIYKSYKETNPDLYLEKEILFLEGKIENKAEHIIKMLSHIETARKKQTVIFLDNADQRDYDTQQRVFIISQEMAERWPSTVFVTLRPETFHLSLRTGGALSGYQSKAFTIAPPRIDKVLEKRLQFALKITRGEIAIPNFNYGSIILKSLETIIMIILDTLKEYRSLNELLENMSGGNVRLALDLLQVFMGSGHVDTQKMIQINIDGGKYRIPVHEFIRALIYGDQIHYDPSRSYLSNLFDSSSVDPKEHFISCIALAFLEISGTNNGNGFIEITSFYDFLQGLGFTVDQIDDCIVRAQRHKLVEASAKRVLQPGKDIPPSIRITSVGAYHLRKLSRAFTYIDAMIVDTPVPDVNREFFKEVYLIEDRIERSLKFCDYLDEAWKNISSKVKVFDWGECSREIREEIQYVKERTGVF